MKGKQRKFIDDVLTKTACPSLGELSKRVGMNYQTLKNFYSERRVLPLELFGVLLGLSNLNRDNFKCQEIPENLGQICGGKKSRKKK